MHTVPEQRQPFRPVRAILERVLRHVAVALALLQACVSHTSTGSSVGAASSPRANQPPPAEGAKSYVIPAVEIVAFQAGLNLWDRTFAHDSEAYRVDWGTIADNLDRGWHLDRDAFGMNQLGHPYTGAIYHAFARSAGLGYWESAAYTMVGSALWEVAGETTQPSSNDQIATGIGGAFLGEGLFRTASWLLEGSGESPTTLRWLGATAASPPTVLNRVMLGDDHAFAAGRPAVSSRVGFGARWNHHLSDHDLSDDEHDFEAAAQTSFDYGLPGKRGYRYERPFDEFHIEISALSAGDNHIDKVSVRGLLVGTDYASGEDTCGVWGLYGGYDYLSPGIFRVASTSVTLGTTAQVRVSSSVTLMGGAYGGVGFGAAGTVADDLEDRDYHHGVIPNAHVDLRLIFGEKVMLRLTGRDLFVVGVGPDAGDGHENVLHGEASLSVRVYESHALRLEYVGAARDSHFSGEPDGYQSVGGLYLLYDYHGGTRFAPVR